MDDNNPLGTPTASNLKDAGVKIRAGTDPASRALDPLGRFLAVPNHAMFLYTSEDKMLGAYVKEHWAALDGLSGDHCDIHMSLLQLMDEEDFFSQLADIRTLPGLSEIRATDLPALHFWSELASCTLSLANIGTEEQLKMFLRSAFSIVCEEARPMSNAECIALTRLVKRTPEVWGGNNRLSMQGATAGRDIIQVTHIHSAATQLNSGDSMMANKHVGDASSASGGQSMEDVIAGGGVSQSSDTGGDAQSMRRVTTPGIASQKKAAASEMTFVWGKARGRGIVGLVIAFLAFLAYQYFSAK